MSVVANVAVNLDARNAIQNANNLRNAVNGIKPAADKAKTATNGLGNALKSALGPILALSTAVAAFNKSINTAFARGAAEQKLRNFTSSTEEYNAALAVAADSASKFGLSQTETTQALADTLSRLKGLGFGLKETTQIYNGFNAIALQSGTSAEDASSAFFQLSQALGSGRLQGDELRAVLERMPTLAQAIATSMGKSGAEIRQLGADGKLTSEIIYKALSEAADASDNLGSKLNEQQRAQKALLQITDRLFNSIGEAFGPFVVKSIELVTAAGQELGDWWDYLGGVLLPKLQEAIRPVTTALQNAFSQVDIKLLVTVIQNGLIMSLETVITVVGKMSAVLGPVIQKFTELANNPVFRFIAEQVGNLLNMLGLTTNKVDEYKQKQAEVTQEAAKTVDQFSKLPSKADDAKEKAKELKEAQKAVTDEIKNQTKEVDRQFKGRNALLDMSTDLAQEQIRSQQAYNSLVQDELNYKIQNSKTDQERIFYSKQLREAQRKAAELEYQYTLASIKAQLQKVQLAYDEVVAKQKAVETEVELAKAKGIANDSHYRTLQLVKEEVDLNRSRLTYAERIAGQQEIQARLARESKYYAADLAYQQNVISKNTAESARAANTYANNMVKAATAAVTAAAVTRGSYLVSGPSRPSSSLYVGARGGALRPSTGSYTGGIGSFATGGYVTGPQLAMVGEGKDNEYIIPESKAGAFATNYLMGARGHGAIPQYADGGYTGPINIQTGPVMQQDGSRYVTLSQFEQGMMDLASAMSSANRSYGARTYLGVGR